MNLQFTLVFASSLVLCINGYQNPALQPPNNLTDYGPTQPSDCLGKSVRNVIYRYEGYVPANPEVRPGCEVKFGVGHSPYDSFHGRGLFGRKILKYFVMDAVGEEKLVTRDGAVTLNLTSSGYPVVRNLTWDRLCFPYICYKHGEDWEHSCSYPFEPTTCPFQNNTEQGFRLGKVTARSISVHCHPANKTRLPLLTAFHSPPASEIEEIHEYNNETFEGPQVVYKYWFSYLLPGPGSPNNPNIPNVHWVGCELRTSVTSLGQVYRTFFYSKGGKKRVIPMDEATSKYGHLRSVKFRSWPKPIGTLDMCFPSQCFPKGFEPPCETGSDREQYFSIDFREDKYNAMIYGNTLRKFCTTMTMSSKADSSIGHHVAKTERALMCSEWIKNVMVP